MKKVTRPKFSYDIFLYDIFVTFFLILVPTFIRFIERGDPTI